MLYNNYLQALRIIEMDNVALREAMGSLEIEQDNIEKWYAEEAQYFAMLRQEPEWDVHAMTYVESLQELRDIEKQLSSTSSTFYAGIPDSYQFLPPTPESLMEWHTIVSQDVIEMEVNMQLSKQWVPTDHEYLDTVRYISTCKYHHALDNLQRLVVLHLFELHKLNLLQTAYRMRMHIAKSLQTRCEAIRNAVQVYNAAAGVLNPPRPTLDWAKISHYSFLDEFDLLHDTRNDIYALEGFSGMPSPGQCRSLHPQVIITASDAQAPVHSDILQEDDDAAGEDEEAELQINGLVEYICNLSIQ
ncbi:hypothetical protein SCP_0508060 [Sparassis crispa]|uniref:Uncharacterized protein n=1 Tax=Sparassis crispa TaxID=139825 RepID=A0A401GNJ7_9APHY|nr:hypothetical protein SCP_0508060 [Sparassis crispa]GBE83750.1 hypothetical protein SCP_0508060 [Sparassis crispa]